MPPHCALWHAYDKTVKADLFSTAVATEDSVVLLDPIQLSDEGQAELETLGQISAIIVTNHNHSRAAGAFAQRYRAEIFAGGESEFQRRNPLNDATSVKGLSAFSVDGAAAGEFVFHDARAGGTLFAGDALINFEPYGFALLPAKYCTNQKQMIESLQRLLDLAFSRIFFAHGNPIIMEGRDRLAGLLDRQG